MDGGEPTPAGMADSMAPLRAVHGFVVDDASSTPFAMPTPLPRLISGVSGSYSGGGGGGSGGGGSTTAAAAGNGGGGGSSCLAGPPPAASAGARFGLDVAGGLRQHLDAARDKAEAAAAAALPPEVARALDRLLQGAARGAAIGFTLRGGLHLLGAALARAGGRRRGRSLPARDALLDTARYTAFLAAFAAVHIGADEAIAALVGKEASAKWRGLVAGLLAGPSLVLVGRRERHYSLATYILLRGLTLLVRVGNKPATAAARPRLHALLAPTRLQHGDTLLMCLGCAQVISCFIMAPHLLPPSYVRFIRRQGAKEPYVWAAIRELAERTSAGRPLAPLAALVGTPHEGRGPRPLPCDVFHPGRSCAGHPAALFPVAFSRALSVYVPVYVLPALLVHRGALLRDPAPILRKVAAGVVRSSAFLAAAICLAFGGACAGHRAAGRSTGAVIALSTWVGGLATLLEKKSRRMELALYVASRAVESACRCAVEWRWVARPRWLPPRLDVLLFSLGVGAITHCYSDDHGRHRDVFRAKFLGVIDWVLGTQGFAQGSIKHVPSNSDLLRGAASRGRAFVRSLSHGSLHTRSASQDQSLGDLVALLPPPPPPAAPATPPPRPDAAAAPGAREAGGEAAAPAPAPAAPVPVVGAALAAAAAVAAEALAPGAGGVVVADAIAADPPPPAAAAAAAPAAAGGEAEAGPGSASPPSSSSSAAAAAPPPPSARSRAAAGSDDDGAGSERAASSTAGAVTESLDGGGGGRGSAAASEASWAQHAHEDAAGAAPAPAADAGGGPAAAAAATAGGGRGGGGGEETPAAAHWPSSGRPPSLLNPDGAALRAAHAPPSSAPVPMPAPAQQRQHHHQQQQQRRQQQRRGGRRARLADAADDGANLSGSSGGTAAASAELFSLQEAMCGGCSAGAAAELTSLLDSAAYRRDRSSGGGAPYGQPPPPPPPPR